jgi:hypothetical protein
MKVIALVLLAMFALSLPCWGSVLDNAADKVSEKLNKAVDDSAQKMSNKVGAALEKGADWLIKKALAVIFFIVEVFAIIGIGWILSYICDRDSRKMVRILVILCVISLTVDKLVSLIN